MADGVWAAMTVGVTVGFPRTVTDGPGLAVSSGLKYAEVILPNRGQP
jgi:hypothetical protein